MLTMWLIFEAVAVGLWLSESTRRVHTLPQVRV